MWGVPSKLVLRDLRDMLGLFRLDTADGVGVTPFTVVTVNMLLSRVLLVVVRSCILLTFHNQGLV